MDNLDNKISEIFKKDIELPNSYQYTIRNTIKKQPKHHFFKNKFNIIPAIGGIAILVSTVTFATTNIVQELLEYYNSSKGMNKAISEGYIETPNMNYIESNGTEVKVKDFLMDDFNLALTFDIAVQDDIDISKIAETRIANFIITDDNKNILYCDSETLFNDFVEKNNLNYKFRKYDDGYINCGFGYFIREKKADTNSMEFVFKIYGEDFPKSKKLYITFLNLYLSERETNENDEEIALSGNWNIELDVPDKFYNREAVIYKVSKCNNPDIYDVNFVVYDTGSKLHFKKKIPKIYDEGDSEEEIHEKLVKKLEEDTYNWRNNINQDNWAYIETDAGIRYSESDGYFGEEGISFAYLEGIIYYNCSLELTTTEAPQNLKIYVGLRDEVYTFELER